MNTLVVMKCLLKLTIDVGFVRLMFGMEFGKQSVEEKGMWICKGMLEFGGSFVKLGSYFEL